jgi:hypothetical protein
MTSPSASLTASDLTDAELLGIHTRIWHSQTDDNLTPGDVYVLIGRAIANAAVARSRSQEGDPLNDHPALVAEARDHIEALCVGLPDTSASLVRAGAAADQRVSLIVKLADALESTLPKKTVRYVTVRPATENPKPGELVQSKWDGSAAVWRIVGVHRIASGRATDYDLEVLSLASQRRGSRRASGLVIVEAIS